MGRPIWEFQDFATVDLVELRCSEQRREKAFGDSHDEDMMLELNQELDRRGIHRNTCPVVIVKLTNYDGNDTRLDVTPEPLFMVVDPYTGEELDNGYRSRQEAAKAWPLALNKEGIK